MSAEREVCEEPVTEYDSKMTMLRGERVDTVTIEPQERLSDGAIPERATIVRRTDPYYGPKLVLDVEGHPNNHLLTAPGPDTQLLLWGPDLGDGGLRKGWYRLAFVTAEIVQTKQYSICEQCGEPLKTSEHIRESTFGLCGRVGGDPE